MSENNNNLPSIYTLNAIGNNGGRVSPNPPHHHHNYNHPQLSTTMPTGHQSMKVAKEASISVELCGFNENTWFGIGKKQDKKEESSFIIYSFIFYMYCFRYSIKCYG